MSITRRVRLYVEALEERLPLNADAPDATIDPSATDPAATEIIDPTADPADPANATTVATVTSVETTSSGEVVSITLDGLDPNNVASADSITVQVGDAVYQVDYTVAQSDGQFTFYFVAGNAPTVAVGDQVTVIFGGGGDATSPPPDSSTDPIDPIDPTGDPAP